MHLSLASCCLHNHSQISCLFSVYFKFINAHVQSITTIEYLNFLNRIALHALQHFQRHLYIWLVFFRWYKHISWIVIGTVFIIFYFWIKHCLGMALLIWRFYLNEWFILRWARWTFNSSTICTWYLPCTFTKAGSRDTFSIHVWFQTTSYTLRLRSKTSSRFLCWRQEPPKRSAIPLFANIVIQIDLSTKSISDGTSIDLPWNFLSCLIRGYALSLYYLLVVHSRCKVFLLSVEAVMSVLMIIT